MYDEIHQWHAETLLQRAAEALERRGFNAEILTTAEAILTRVEALIPLEASVGVGGSVTLRELELPEALARRGNTVHDHWQSGLTPEEVYEIRRRQLTADFFLTSTNAVTLDGELVNIDGAGNRVAAMSFGPRHVIVVASAAKIVRNVDEALRRIHDIASPQNCRRLGLKNPCATAGHCLDCSSDSTACRIISIVARKPVASDYTVILTPLKLGF